MKRFFPSLSARTSLLLPLPLLAFGVAAPLAACSGDLGGSGGAATTTTSSTATGTGEGGGGGATPAARVIVRDHSGRPAVGVDVLVHDAKGLTTQQTKTDKTGAAVVDLVMGGGVTALWKGALDSADPGYQAVSVVGLARDAEVRLVADQEVVEAPAESMSLSFTGTAPLQSTEWDIVVSCREDTMFAETGFSYPGCSDADTYDLVAFLYPRDKRIVFPAQPKQPGMSAPFVLDASQAEVAPLVVVDMDEFPKGTLSLEARLWANRPEGGRTQVLVQQIASDPQGKHLEVPRLFVAPGGTFDLDFAANTPVSSVHARLAFGEKDLPTSAIAWKGPLVTPIGEIGTIAGEVGRPEVPWKLELGGALSDAVRIQLSYSAPDSPPSKLGEHPVRWTLYSASNISGTASFPAIPESLPGFAPVSAALTVTAEHVDVPGTESLLAAVNADFDRTGSAWTSKVVSAMSP
jgi:hypothetical protein